MAEDTEALLRLAFDARTRVKAEAAHRPVWVGVFDHSMPWTQSAWRAAMLVVLQHGGHAAGDPRADRGLQWPSRVDANTSALARLAYATYLRVLAESLQVDVEGTLGKHPWDALSFQNQYAWVAAVRTMLWRRRA